MKIFSFLLPFWYPLLEIKNLTILPKKGFLFSDPYVISKNKEKDYVVHTDICPHQGASLSEGWMTEDKCLACPYHGFQFYNGSFCKIPHYENDDKKFKSKIELDRFHSYQGKDFLFISNRNHKDIPFYPKEEYDSSFRGVQGSLIINTNYLSVCENLLDMLHISYVHSFGSKKTPLPSSISFEKVSDFHGKSTFHYSPNPNTISGKIGKVDSVCVENEYILPTNTITRVFAGKTIKTVFTRSIPLFEDKTLLYWKIYRNFYIHPFFDFFIRFLMEKTLKEDVSILKNVYPSFRNGTIKTKYDKTILEFRNSYQSFLEKEKLM